MAVLLLCAAIPAPARTTSQDSSKAGPSASVPVLPRGKKLVLKDGSFQLVREYVIEGDRVRYYSVERSQWEFVPEAMVDWDATHAAETAEAKRNEAEVAKIRERETASQAQAVDVDASIEAVPGLFLPSGEGVFLLDGKQFLTLTEAETGTKTDKHRVLTQILVPIPLAKRQNITMKGARAKIRIANSQAEFYIRTVNGPDPRVELIRAQVRGDSRRLESLDTLFAQSESNKKTISVERWELARGVYRLTLSQPLLPGEYALTEVLPGEELNLYVWDFGVDGPGAPESKK